jgi:hypothetical protein
MYYFILDRGFLVLRRTAPFRDRRLYRSSCPGRQFRNDFKEKHFLINFDDYP